MIEKKLGERRICPGEDKTRARCWVEQKSSAMDDEAQADVEGKEGRRELEEGGARGLPVKYSGTGWNGRWSEGKAEAARRESVTV